MNINDRIRLAEAMGKGARRNALMFLAIAAAVYGLAWAIGLDLGPVCIKGFCP